MKYFCLPVSFLLFFCATSHSQTTICTFPTLKSETIKLNEFNKLDSIELDTKSCRVFSYAAYFACGEESKNVTDSICQNILGVRVNGNSLKDPAFLKLLSKFSPPFKILFDEVRVVDLKNTHRIITGPLIRIQ